MKTAVIGIFRSLCMLISTSCYRLTIYFYDIFVRLGHAQILNSSQVEKIYSRVTLILGIFMLFKLMFSFVQYVLNPELMSDKSKGASKIVTKAVVVVALLGTTPFIFQQAYKLQDLILDSNILGKIIFATDGETEVEDFGSELVTELFFSFYSKYDNESCPALGDNYSEIKAEIKALHRFDLAYDCLNEEGDNNDFVINYETHGLISAFVSVFVLYIILSYCLSVGMRVIQLAFLQLIAPIPILSYLGEDKDGAFSKWVKRCVSTFLDLFIRLVIIYFVVYVISFLLDTDSSSYYLFLNTTGDPTGFLKRLILVIIIIGLLMFAKKAPELLKEVLPQGIGGQDYGFKNTNKYLGGAASLLGGVAARGAMALIGNTGAAISAGQKRWRAVNAGYRYGYDKNGNRVYGKYDNDGNLIAGSELTGDKLDKQIKARRSAVARSVLGGIGTVAARTALGSVQGLATSRNGNVAKNVGGAIKKQVGVNNRLRYATDQGSTFVGRTKERIANITGYEMAGTAARYESDLASYKDAQSTLKTYKAIMDRIVTSRKDIYNSANSDIETSTFSSDVCIAAQNRYREIQSISSSLTQTGQMSGADLKKSIEEAYSFYSNAASEYNNKPTDAAKAEMEKYKTIFENLKTKCVESKMVDHDRFITFDTNGKLNVDDKKVLDASPVINDATLSSNIIELVSSRKDSSVKEIASYRMKAKKGDADYDVTTADAVRELERVKNNYNDVLSKYVTNSNVVFDTTDYGNLNKYRKEVQSVSQELKGQIDDYQVNIDKIEQSNERSGAMANREAAKPMEGGVKGGPYKPHGMPQGGYGPDRFNGGPPPGSGGPPPRP